MKFAKYHSLTNHYQTKMVDYIRSSELLDIKWVATEKIHGANFGMWYNGSGEVRFSKRSSFCGEEFFSCHRLDKYKTIVKEVYGILEDSCLVREGEVVAIFGEIFGGNFFGDSVEGVKCIQGGMDYHPDVEFAAFDIMIEGEYLPYDRFYDVLSETKMVMAPEMAVGSFEDLLAMESTFESLVPKNFGLDSKGKNSMVEGFVMKPYSEVPFLGETRVAIKSKNEKFNERKPKSGEVSTLPLTEEFKNILEGLTAYITENRLKNVVSQQGEVCWKDFKMLVGRLVGDSIKSYQEDTDILVKKTFEDSWHLVSQQLNKEGSLVVREFLKSVG